MSIAPAPHETKELETQAFGGISVTFDCYGTDETVNAGEFYNCIG